MKPGFMRQVISIYLCSICSLSFICFLFVLFHLIHCIFFVCFAMVFCLLVHLFVKGTGYKSVIAQIVIDVEHTACVRHKTKRTVNAKKIRHREKHEVVSLSRIIYTQTTHPYLNTMQ